MFFLSSWVIFENLLDICPTETSRAMLFLKTEKFGVSAESYHENKKYVNPAILLDGKAANLV